MEFWAIFEILDDSLCEKSLKISRESEVHRIQKCVIENSKFSLNNEFDTQGSEKGRIIEV